jgi:molybdopterin converting factor subunit 1
MLVTIKLFARLREIAGGPDVTLVLPAQATVLEAWQALAGRFPDLSAYAGSVSCAVNEDYARMNARLKDGDEVAFLPPVSGG